MGQNPKIGQIWCPVAPQPFVAQQSRPAQETPWPMAWLQRGVNIISLQCIPWPAALSEVPVWPNFDFRFWGKWPLKWKFSKFFFRIPRRDTKIRFVTKFRENRPLRSWRKIAWFTKQKKLGSARLVPAQFWPKRADRVQNFLNVVTRWPVHVYRIWSGSAAFCRTYFGKIDFFYPKVNTIIAFSLQ